VKFVVFVGMGVALLATPKLDTDTGVYTTSAGKECPLKGSGKSDGSLALNPRKNRFTFPKMDDIDPDVTLAGMLLPGDDEERFDAKKAATITGYVVNVKFGGKETCNCGAAATIDKDTHIELALDKDAPPTQRVIVEVTPRLRLLMKDTADWSTETLQKETGPGIKGKWVKVTGWLMFDDIHSDEAENTNPGNPKNWRATCWELHPVTKIEVLPGAPPGTPALQPATMAAFHKAHVDNVKRDPKRQDAIKAAIKSRLAKYDEEDLKEKEEEAKDRNK
jgi:hypothetical protein